MKSPFMILLLVGILLIITSTVLMGICVYSQNWINNDRKNSYILFRTFPDKPFGFSQWFYNKRHSLIVEITDQGPLGMENVMDQH